MKKSKVVIPALGLIALSTAASITGTVAWFSANNVVTISGMQVRTKVGDNLLVSATNADAASYSTSLAQTRTGILEPVSTIDALTFHYHATSGLDGSGKPTDSVYVEYDEDTSNTDTPAGKTAYDDGFQVNYGINAPTEIVYGFIDYTYYVKAINGGSGPKELVITELDIKYNGGEASQKAWRVAVFAQEAEEYTALGDAIVDGDRTAMLARTGSSQYTPGKAVDDSGALNDVTYTSADWSVATVTAGATSYTKVTVRLWLEGEDSTCNNETFANLTNQWALNIEMKLEGNDDNSIKVLQSIAAVATVDAGNAKKADAVLKDVTAASYQWYTSSDDQPIADADDASYTNEASARDVYCKITSTAGKIYQSNVVSLAAA
jgi:hypothetical protein